MIAAFIGAVAMVAAALIGLWGSLREPTTTAVTVPEPPARPVPAEPRAAVAATSSSDEAAVQSPPVDFKSCEDINRRGPNTLSRSIFNIGDEIIAMMDGNYASFEIENYLRQFDGMMVIDCGYITNITASAGGEVWVVIERSPEDSYGRVSCYFGDEWDTKLRTLERNRRIAFTGIVDHDYHIFNAVYLGACSVLKVE